MGNAEIALGPLMGSPPPNPSCPSLPRHRTSRVNVLGTSTSWLIVVFLPRYPHQFPYSKYNMSNIFRIRKLRRSVPAIEVRAEGEGAPPVPLPLHAPIADSMGGRVWVAVSGWDGCSGDGEQRKGRAPLAARYVLCRLISTTSRRKHFTRMLRTMFSTTLFQLVVWV